MTTDTLQGAVAPPNSRLHDAGSRGRKARKITAILRDAGRGDLSSLHCLDVGCATGLMTRILAPSFSQMLGVEYEEGALVCTADDGTGVPRATNTLLVRGDAMHLPLPDASVDLVICAQVYEHVHDADAMAAEIWRVLAPGGACFFSGPNRLAVMEEHCHLPFVSWLPRSLANAYVRLMGRGPRYEEAPRTWWGLRRLWRDFEIVDYTVAMIEDPAKYECAEESAALAWFGRLPGWLLRALTPLYPNYNWVLFKRGGEVSS